MANAYGTYVFDLDETLADSRWLKDKRDAAAKDHSKRGAVEAEARRNMDPFDGMPELVRGLRADGGWVAVLTNSWRDYAMAALESMGMPGDVDLLVGSAGKPRFGKLAKIVAGRGIRPDGAVHVGDNLKDLDESVNAKVGFVMCLWGEYGKSRTVLTPAQKGVMLGSVAGVRELRGHLIRKGF